MATPALETAPERLKGYLTITIAEASGRNREDEEVWDPAFVEGFVKGALHFSNSFLSQNWRSVPLLASSKVCFNPYHGHSA